MDMDTSHDYSWLNINFSLGQHCDMEEEERGAAAELAAIAGAAPPPKLEDFLGGGGPVSGPSRQAAAAELYESELKFIAAGFLSGAAVAAAPSPPAALEQADENHLALPLAAMAPAPEQKKAADSFGQRTSIYRGVTRHRWTGRYEAHLWDNSCRREGQSRKGRQGGYDKQEKAARAYDLAALKYWGASTTTNFPVAEYEKELEEMKHMTRQEFVASLRRKSSGFSRGASIYRGVTRHHQHGRWQARIGRVAGNKDLYLGTFGTEEEAAEAYDIAAIKFRGLNAVTNFEIGRYNVESIINSNLPIGSGGGGVAGSSRSAKCGSLELLQAAPSSSSPGAMPAPAAPPSSSSHSSALAFAALPVKYDPSDYLSYLALQHHQQGNLQGLGFGLYSSGVNLDFANGNGAMPHCYSNGGNGALHDHHQQQEDQSQGSNSCSSTPVAYSGPYESSMTAASSFGYYPNAAAFQTPIFGME
ncbi:hypothetical protein GUJ93_ZPchr0004g39214 [Zizania palustris]|uniref:AP2/ERF domain-containing protein n=1 Tax=Zizania palustris TaxID=103762 RepID=A0A8J5SL69_ZIZPA|nr:hypothetical protein GUJ93_ZPchr0004g39214 [Zizania palustris]